LAPDAQTAQAYIKPVLQFHFGLPLPSLDFINGISPALKFLPIAIPFAILTVVGGINVTESARVAGDDYSARGILLTEALATLVSGICGGVAQSCPYIGHPAYKRMGARAGYTVLTAIFIGLGGIFGYVSMILELIPRAVLAPILVFISLEIVGQAFLNCPARHIPAVIFAIFPTVSRLLAIHLETPEIVPIQNLEHLVSKVGVALPEALVIIALGNGFILTGMLWGSFLAEMIDHRLRVCSVYLTILAIFSFFGIIHSAFPDGNVYFPWSLTGTPRLIPYEFGQSYLLLAMMMFFLSFTKRVKEQAPIVGA
jgi:AGZA family xanthine/uracil permease-like MFS transporter